MYYPLEIIHKRGEITKISIPDGSGYAMAFKTQAEAKAYLMKNKIRGVVAYDIYMEKRSAEAISKA